MNVLRRLFGKIPVEPIFPGENFTIARLNFPEGWGLAAYNKAYAKYPNKRIFPWLILIELEINAKNDNGHPMDEEAIRLQRIEEQIGQFIGAKHIAHFIARLTKPGFRELLYYTNAPHFTQAEVNQFCDNIMRERGINFTVKRDPKWRSVSGFIE